MREYDWIKRVFDFLLAGFLLILLFPLFFLIFFIVFAEQGRVFYFSDRIGKEKKKFRIYKFSTLSYDDSEQISVSSDDRRVSKTGRILRRYKLDEIPQLVNILRGEMSFVGPRPEVEYFVEKYSEEQERVFDAVPGLTDFASIKFINEGEILEKAGKNKDIFYEKNIMPEKLKLQLKYLQKRSFFLDIKLILRTVRIILNKFI
jgi:lipopolysaccharide/colanic/teichoic acid biosynthesis glycosyltransferase